MMPLFIIKFYLAFDFGFFFSHLRAQHLHSVAQFRVAVVERENAFTFPRIKRHAQWMFLTH